jgi:exopolysaccharide biosynthesis WecB/TagA/CpsF family protein
MLNAKSGILDSQRLKKREIGRREGAQGSSSLRNILGVNVLVFTRNAALSHISRLLATNTHTKFSFLNAHGANTAWVNEAFARDLTKFEVLADGIGVDMGSLINYGKKFPDNLNGTDFIPAMLDYLEGGVSVVLLGAEPGVADMAAERLQERFPDHAFSVASHGFFSRDEEVGILDWLAEKKPDILLAALGNPAQEKWIVENCSAKNCTLVFGVGAYFDFVAQRVPRAPVIFRRMRLEWLFRLGLEPQRMWRRYVVGNPAFLLRSLMQKYRLGRSKRFTK